MSDEQSELHRLREEALQLQRRLDDLNRRLDGVVAQAAPPPFVAPAPPPPPKIEPPPVIQTPSLISMPPVAARPVVPAVPKESFEVRLGTFWLPRIGMAALLTGLVWAVTWSYQYLGRGGKVALSYLCAAALGGLGVWLEKKMPQFGRVLQAGGMALAYFVTYAMHFSEALRVIESPTLALSLLAIVVAGIVIVADRRKSALLAGMALFFGYYTSVVSGVATFTLASNAVLAAAALWFLARNRWVPISYGAVLATYLTYMIWVWQLNRWGDLDHLIWDAGYLSGEAFRLRAAFLSIYWLLFTAGGLLVNREALNTPERNGLLTLNNLFFFLLFSLLMHHAHPGAQWQFHFSFGGALLLLSALAYQRFQPERSVMDGLFLQGLAVATLGIVSYFEGGTLAAVLAVESLLVLWLARWMASPWLPWIARAAFAMAFFTAWPRYPGVWAGWFAAAIGFVCARSENRSGRGASAAFFAVAATALAMRVADVYFDPPDMPWVWVAGAVIVAAMAGALRTREIFWAAHLPLAWAFGGFLFVALDAGGWELAPSLALIAVTLLFGLFVWGGARARDDATDATNALSIYVLAATVAIIVTTLQNGAAPWRPAVLMIEALVLLLVGHRLNERAFILSAVGPFSVAVVIFVGSRLGWLPASWDIGLAPALALIAATFVFALSMWGRARAAGDAARAGTFLWLCGLPAMMMVLTTTWEHCPDRWRLAVFAAETLTLVIAARLADEPVFVWLSMAPLAAGAAGHSFANRRIYGVRSVAWTNLLTGVALLVATERVLSRESTFRKLRTGIVLIVTVVAMFALRRLVASAYLTVDWAVLGFMLLALGFAVKARAWRLAGLAMLTFSLLRAVLHDMAALDTPYRILSFIGLGAILLVLGFLYTKNREKLAKWL